MMELHWTGWMQPGLLAHELSHGMRNFRWKLYGTVIANPDGKAGHFYEVLPPGLLDKFEALTCWKDAAAESQRMRDDMRVTFSVPLTPETQSTGPRPLMQSGFTPEEWARVVTIK